MYLEKKNANRHLYHDTYNHHEYTWDGAPNKGQSLVLSICPENYPDIVIWTGATSHVKEEQNKLIEEGWKEETK